MPHKSFSALAGKRKSGICKAGAAGVGEMKNAKKKPKAFLFFENKGFERFAEKSW